MMKKYKIGIIGLGYVGLPLAIEFAKKYITYGFDINSSRINELKNGIDSTLEVEKEEIDNNFYSAQKEIGLILTSELNELKDCNFYIITVPTPIDENKKPDLSPLEKASKSVAEIISLNDIVVYESTVYPGLTEEFCVPIIEKKSGLIYNKDFFLGYSPERINPGDKERTVSKIIKVTSGSNERIALEIDKVYSSVIKAGTHLAPSIKVAEASKVIENAQRDINIAFINELSKIFNLLEIDTNAVLEAAQTKWNFLPFEPGLVGGHCIGVDPYYLASKSIQMGYNPEIILSGRKINDSMGEYAADRLYNTLVLKSFDLKKCKILVAGITFKENCPDVRNTKVVDIINRLESHGLNVDVYDPNADYNLVKDIYDIQLIENLYEYKYDALVIAVPHNEFFKIDFKRITKPESIIFDIKSRFGDLGHLKL